MLPQYIREELADKIKSTRLNILASAFSLTKFKLFAALNGQETVAWVFVNHEAWR